MSLYDSIVIARSAILTHQKRLAVISHNIANVNTEGYHRQRVALGTNPPLEPTMLETRKYSIGTGVRVIDVIRAYNDMKEATLLGEKPDAEYHAQKARGLADMEALVVGIGEASLSARFQDFWNSWQDVANNAGNLAFRSILVEHSVALTDHIRTLDDRLTSFRANIADGIVAPFSGFVADEVDKINNIAAEIQDLNSRISSLPSDYDSNDLMDRRTRLLRELSEKADIVVAADYSITIDGQLLVSGDGATRNDLIITGTAPVTLTLDGAPVTIARGSLGAWIDVAAEVDAFIANLDTLAIELMSVVNDVHNSTLGNAYDLDGNLSALNFFTGTGSSDIVVNPLIHDPVNPLKDNPRLIAAAATIYDPGPPPIPNPGDGAKALEIADLAYQNIVALGDQTFGEFFISLLAPLGAGIQTETDLASNGETVVNLLINSIQAETGVNLDEELIEMISAQRAYEAAARLMKTIDSMLDVIINGLMS